MFILNQNSHFLHILSRYLDKIQYASEKTKRLTNSVGRFVLFFQNYL